MQGGNAISKNLRAQLLLKGFTLSGWAAARGYNPSLVRAFTSRFVGSDKRPQRGLSLKVITELEAETGIKICG